MEYKSTEPEVLGLMKAFDDWPPQAVVAYQDIAVACGLSLQDTRFRTVLKAWRARLFKERSIVTVAIRGQGLRRLTEFERVGAGARNVKRGIDRIREGAGEITAANTAEMDPPERDATMHARRVAEVFERAVVEGSKEVVSALALAPQKPLPRLRAVSAQKG